MVLSTTPPRATKRWATPAAVGLFAVAVALSGVTVVRAENPPTPAEKLNASRLDGWLIYSKTALLQDKPTPPAAPQPPDAPKPPQPPAEAKPARVAEIRGVSDAVWQVVPSEVRVRIDIEKLRKQIDEALAAGKIDEAKKLVDILVVAFAPRMPEAPTPPAVPQPPAREGRVVMAIESADSRIGDALKAMRKAIDATKDPEARDAMEAAFKLLRDMPQDRRYTQTVVGDDGRATVVRQGSMFSGAGGGVFAPAQLPTPSVFGGRAENPGNFGVTVAPLPEALAEQLQLPPRTALLVTAVQPDSPFAKAGVKKNDVFASIGFTQLSTGGVQLQVIPVNGKVVVEIISKGVKKTVEVELPQPRIALARPAAKKVRFESKSISIANESFIIEAKAGEVAYKITGKLADGKIVNYTATITDGKDVTNLTQTGDAIVLTEAGQKYKAALKNLLDSAYGQ